MHTVDINTHSFSFESEFKQAQSLFYFLRRQENVEPREEIRVGKLWLGSVLKLRVPVWSGHRVCLQARFGLQLDARGDRHPVVLTPVIMEYFVLLILTHI